VSEVRTSRVKSRLSSEAFKSGGATVRDAVLHAEAAIELGREACVASIDAILAELETGFGAGATTPAPRDPKRLYNLASAIIDISLCLRGTGIDKAAYALCDLCDLFGDLAVWDQQCVDIHIQVLKLLRHADTSMSPAQRTWAIAGLVKVTARRLGGYKSSR
jgi:hypothetical protein